MTRSQLRLNHSEIQSYLDGGHGVEAALEEAAQKAANAARSNAPVASGAYRDSIHVDTDKTDRMVKRVVADVPYAFVVEANTGNLSRALDSAR